LSQEEGLLKIFFALFLVFSLTGLYGNLYANERRGADLNIQKKDGQQLQGELITVKIDSFLLQDADSWADISVYVGDINKSTIVKKLKALLGIGIGLVVGGVIGAIAGYSSGTDEETGMTITLSEYNEYFYGGIGAGVGALLGGVFGASAGKDITIQIEGKSEAEIKEILEELRKKARIPDFQ
jgi:hypothetical protein